jgi:hypothetical protein
MTIARRPADFKCSLGQDVDHSGSGTGWESPIRSVSIDNGSELVGKELWI